MAAHSTAGARSDGSAIFVLAASAAPLSEGKSGESPALARNRRRGMSSQAGNPAGGES
jgi:hypothetical protein